MNEFDLIRTYLAPLAGPEGLRLDDDAALYRPPDGCELVLTKDTLVEGVHFPNGQYGANTAQKLLRVNLSDLAAKAAKPAGYLLSIAWPRQVAPHPDFAAFAAGLRAVQDLYGCPLFGGDTVRIDGPMVVTATCIGYVPRGRMIGRNGAKPGDDIWVSGTIGGAYLGLQDALGADIGFYAPAESRDLWRAAYHHPNPRLGLRAILRDYASASTDVSDGLIADIEHIAAASGQGITVNVEAVPLSTATREWRDKNGDRALCTLLSAGDDYEIAFAASPDHAEAIGQAGQDQGVLLTRIGAVTPQMHSNKTHSKPTQVKCVNNQGDPVSFEVQGYQHF